MDKKSANVNLISQTAGGTAFTVMEIAYLFILLIGNLILPAFGLNSGIVVQAVFGCFSSLAIIVSVIFIKKRENLKLLDAVCIRKFNPLYLLLAVLLSVSMFFGLGFVNNSVGSFLKNVGLNSGGIALTMNTPLELAVYLIVFGLLPAFFEEIFFRGVIGKSLERTSLITSALVGGLFFALYHHSLVQFFYQLVYGMGLTLIARLAGSVIPCMVSHLINNAGIVLLTYFKLQINFYNPLIIAGGILGLALFALVVFLIAKNKTAGQAEEEKPTKFFVFALLGGISCFLLLIFNLF